MKPFSVAPVAIPRAQSTNRITKIVQSIVHFPSGGGKWGNKCEQRLIVSMLSQFIDLSSDEQITYADLSRMQTQPLRKDRRGNKSPSCMVKTRHLFLRGSSIPISTSLALPSLFAPSSFSQLRPLSVLSPPISLAVKCGRLYRLQLISFLDVLAIRLGQFEMRSEFKPGDPVIFRVTKQSTDPGPRAVEVHPAPSGETYSYQVDKFWTVSEVRVDGTVQLVTRRGKQRSVSKDDVRMRHARWWERWMYRDRFPNLSQPGDLANRLNSSEVDQ